MLILKKPITKRRARKMNNSITTIKSLLKELLKYFLLFVIIFFGYIIFKPLFDLIRDGVIAQCAMILALFLVVLYGLIKYWNKEMNQQLLLRLIVAAGIILRIGYMLYTPSDIRQHDVWTSEYSIMGGLYQDGHYGYAKIIFDQWILPTINRYQFYHPPLNPIIQALWMNVWLGVTNVYNSIGVLFNSSYMTLSTDPTVLYGSNQILSCWYTCMMLFISEKIFKHLDLKNIAYFIAVGFMALFPPFIYMSAHLNNDILCIFFVFISVLFTIRWWKTKSWLDIIILAFMIGLAMMTKLNGAVVALTTAVVFIYEFIKDILSKKKTKILKICCQFILFLAICVPLGLWFQVYFMNTFGVHFGFVFGDVGSIGGLNPNLSTADFSWFERFFLPTLQDLFTDVFAHSFDNVNLWSFAVKTSIFGEWVYFEGEGFALVAVMLAHILAAMNFIITIIYFIRDRNPLRKKTKIIFGLIWLTNIIAFIYFNITMPFGCTMDFRYIIPVTLSIAAFSGIIYEDYKDNDKYKKYLQIYIYGLAILLVVTSLFYCTCI